MNNIFSNEILVLLIVVGVFFFIFDNESGVALLSKKKILANLSDFCDKKGMINRRQKKTYDYIN